MPATLYPIVCVDFRRPTCVTRTPSRKSVNQCEFFDSFGRTPEDYDERLRDFVDRNSPLCLYNNIQVQPDFSSTCGLHVLYYLNARARGISMSDIVNKSSEMRVRDILPNRD